MEEIIYKDLSYVINGICYKVQNKLGTKFQEKHYVRAVCALMHKEGIAFVVEVPFTVTFEGEFMGKFRADMIVDNKILIEFKTVPFLTDEHKQQTIRYLKALDLRLGLIINFRVYPLQIIRVPN
ncbi:GxxExxY protein [Patescibacteria group bacterium]|nr:GxxExxY protein [Patescibacteria group bacterium]